MIMKAVHFGVSRRLSGLVRGTVTSGAWSHGVLTGMASDAEYCVIIDTNLLGLG